MKSVTIKDIAEKAGLGVATVDRVLNRRAPVRQETEEKVLDAARRLGYRFQQAHLVNVPSLTAGMQIKMGFILPPRDYSFYDELSTELLRQARSYHNGSAPPEFFHGDITAIQQTAEIIRELATRVQIIGVIALDHALIRHAIEEVTRSGVKVFALFSTLSSCGHAGYIGLDNRKAGRTAAWAMERFNPTIDKVGIILGDNRFLCQETCESSFRSYLRERKVAHHILEPVNSHENAAGGYAAAEQLLNGHQDLSVIYAPCGGIEGVAAALDDSGRKESVMLICHGPFQNGNLALFNGTVDMMISHRLKEYAAAVFETFNQSMTNSGIGFINVTSPFEILTPENC